MTPVAMNDDKHNDVWVSCYYGNSTSFGMMSKIVNRPKFCSFEPKIGQLDRILEEKESFGKKCAFL